MFSPDGRWNTDACTCMHQTVQPPVWCAAPGEYVNSLYLCLHVLSILRYTCRIIRGYQLGAAALWPFAVIPPVAQHFHSNYISHELNGEVGVSAWSQTKFYALIQVKRRKNSNIIFMFVFIKTTKILYFIFIRGLWKWSRNTNTPKSNELKGLPPSVTHLLSQNSLYLQIFWFRKQFARRICGSHWVRNFAKP